MSGKWALGALALILGGGHVDGAIFAGLDFGTSGARLALVRPVADGKRPFEVLFEARRSYARGGSPSEWLDALEALLDEVPAPLRQDIAGVLVSGTSASCLVVDRAPSAADGRRRVRRGPRMYDHSVVDDPCGQRALEVIGEFAPENHIVRSPTSSLAKLVTWELEEPIAADEVFCHQADFVAASLCGPDAPVTSDWHNTLKLGFNVADAAPRYPPWLEELLRKNCVHCPAAPADLLPAALQPGSAGRTIGPAVASRLGLPPACRVHAGTTDSNAAFVAATGGLTQPGTAVTSLGSTLALKLVSQSVVEDVAVGAYSHRLGDAFLVGA